MALSQDFEKRRRERLAMQRRKRERMKKIRRIVLALIGIIIIFVLIMIIAKCAKNGTSSNEPEATAAVTEAPTPEASASISGIPQPDEDDNDLLGVIKDSGETKHAYLTFDGGPDNTVTPQILDALRRYNVKATFFVVGKNIEANPYLCTRMIEEGHLVAPLSYTNNPDILYEDKDGFADEVDKTYKLIVENTLDQTEPFKVYRFIGGSGSNTTFGSAKQTYKGVLAKNGYYFADWNTPVDDEDGKRSAEQLVSNFDSNRADVNNLVIRMHNTDKNANTAEALDEIIKKLLDDGYTFSRLDEIDFSQAPETTEKVTDKPEDIKATDAPKSDTATKATTAPKPAATTAPKSNSTSSGTSSGGSKTTSGTSSGGSKTTSGTSTNTSGGSKTTSGTSSGTSGSSQTTSGGTANTAPQTQKDGVITPE